MKKRIKSLEEFLETPLFVRHSRSVRLTPQGARLLPGVQRGMGELTRAVDQLRLDRSSGLLNISLLAESAKGPASSRRLRNRGEREHHHHRRKCNANRSCH